jgi:hypothetical protein
MPTRYITRQATVRGATGLPAAAPIYVDSDDNKLKMIPAGSGSTEVEVVDASSAQTLTNKTLTAAMAVDPIEVVTATNVILASESGKTFFLNSATEFVSTLPAPAAGLKFTFIVTGAPSGASYTVVGASGTPIHGMVLSKDLNGATDSGATAGTGVLTLTFVDSKSLKGDRADFISDGTDWFVEAKTGGNFDAITLS